MCAYWMLTIYAKKIKCVLIENCLPHSRWWRWWLLFANQFWIYVDHVCMECVRFAEICMSRSVWKRFNPYKALFWNRTNERPHMCLTIDQWTFNKTIQLLRRPALVGIASCLELRCCFLLVLEKNTSEIRFADSASARWAVQKSARTWQKKIGGKKRWRRRRKPLKSGSGHPILTRKALKGRMRLGCKKNQ